MRSLLYRIYERRLAASLVPDRLPHHVAVVIDGNRRWARAAGAGDVRTGYEAGASKVPDFLQWCVEIGGVSVVTIYMLSADNLNRPEQEVRPLIEVIEGLVTQLGAAGRWRINQVGARDLLPEGTQRVLKAAEDDTRDNDGLLVNVAIGYGGRREVADAVRSLLHEQATQGITIEELAEVLDVEHIAAHLYTKGQPDPDLIIRTSGEQRLSDFLLWQSAYSEFFFCEAYWPDFRKVDFLRAIRSYAERSRRFGK